MGQWNLVIGLLKRANIVIEVLDARCPAKTRSRKLEKIASELGKPLLLVINKADLVPVHILTKEKETLEKDHPTIYVSVKGGQGGLLLRKSIKKLAKADNAIGIVVGYPNVGKSSIINLLVGRQSAPVSPMPGHTKKEQLIRIGKNLSLLDVPGVIPSEDTFSPLTSTVKPGTRATTRYAAKLLGNILDAQGNNFSDIYGIPLSESEDVLEEIAKKFNFRKSGGVYDIERAASKVLQDWNAGRLSAWWEPNDKTIDHLTSKTQP